MNYNLVNKVLDRINKLSKNIYVVWFVDKDDPSYSQLLGAAHSYKNAQKIVEDEIMNEHIEIFECYTDFSYLEDTYELDTEMDKENPSKFENFNLEDMKKYILESSEYTNKEKNKLTIDLEYFSDRASRTGDDITRLKKFISLFKKKEFSYIRNEIKKHQMVTFENFCYHFEEISTDKIKI